MSGVEKLTILHTINGRRWTGVAEPAVQLAEAEHHAGHRVILAVEEGGDLETRGRDLGLEVVTGYMSARANPFVLAGQWRGFQKYLKELKPDLVHCHLLHDHWLSAAAGCGKAWMPKLVRTFHREEEPRRDPMHRWLAGRTNGAAAISSGLEAKLRGAYGDRIGLVATIGGQVDCEQYKPGGDPAIYRAEWEVPPDAPVVGLLSRLRRPRGIFWLLDAVEPLLERVPGAYVVFCGRGRHADELKAAIEKHPRRDQIRYRGYVPPERLNEAYAAMDLHCLLGPGNDGTCRAALQSMACGRPLIALNEGATKDYLVSRSPEEGGILVNKNNIPALAEAIAHYLADRSAAHRAGEAARDYVRQNHNIIKHSAAYQKLYHKIV